MAIAAGRGNGARQRLSTGSDVVRAGTPMPFGANGSSEEIARGQRTSVRRYGRAVQLDAPIVSAVAALALAAGCGAAVARATSTQHDTGTGWVTGTVSFGRCTT